MTAMQQSLRRDLERNHRYLEFLVMAGDLLSRSIDYDETLQAVCAAAVRSVADICLLDLASPAGGLHRAATAQRDGADDSDVLVTAGRFLRSEPGFAPHPVVEVIRTGVPHVATAIDEAYVAAHASSAEHAEFMRRLRYRAMIVVPLPSATQGVVGALTLIRTAASDEQYDELTVSFATDLGRRCGMAIAKALLYRQNERISTRFQRAALPARVPQVDRITFDGYYEPSTQELLVGGDWYDAFVLPDGRISITIGDVLGHGLDAAVWMSRMRNGLRAALLGDPDPARALAIGDALLRLESDDQFTTAIVALLDPEHLTLTCASAGHPGPLIWDAEGDGVVDPFSERGLPLGLAGFERGIVPSQTITLYPGAFAVFFTDGLLEWNRDIASAWAAMQSAVASREVRESAHPARALRELVIGDAHHADDLAILTLRCERPAA